MNTERNEFFPDGTPIDPWFYETDLPALDTLGKQYKITDYGVRDDGRLYTAELQALIDRISTEGGGVMVIPAGTYLSGALFFKPGVSLWLTEGATLKGSDYFMDYPLMMTRIEGEWCRYFPALVNADGVDGFTIGGTGVIDGNGERSWRGFWTRLSWNPKGSNKDDQRPRLLFVSNSKNVTISGVTLQNSHFWTTHVYKCDHVKYLSCRIQAPHTKELRAPSSDAIDIDVCTDVLIKDCFFDVNDDSVVLKGGRGPLAATLPENGENQRILVEDCVYNYCHGVLTCGSESIHNRNVIVRRCKVLGTINLLWFKLRQDTAQHYEYILIEDLQATGTANFINMKMLTGHETHPGLFSRVNNVTLRNCTCDCHTFYNVEMSPARFSAKDFTLENVSVKAVFPAFDETLVENTVAVNVVAEKK